MSEKKDNFICSQCHHKWGSESWDDCPLCGSGETCIKRKAEATRPQDSSGSAEFALLSARKLKAFDWLDANADELSMEWTGTHNHIYSGNEENLERLGCGRSLLEAIENCMDT